MVCVGWFAGQAARERRNRIADADEQRAERERQHAADLRPAAVDGRMPAMDGNEATRQLLDDPATSEIRVLILTTFDLDDYVFAALKAGAIRTFVPRPTGHLPIAPSLLDPLTPRETETHDHVAAGHSNTEIGAELSIGVATVKTHVSRLLAKLQAHDRAQLVVIAYETGLVERAART